MASREVASPLFIDNMSICLAIFLAVFRMVVIPAQFEDKAFVSSSVQIEKNMSTAEQYFNEQFQGIKSFSFEIAPTVTLSRPLAYYGSNYPDRRDVLLHEAVREACILSDEAINFADYSNIVILFAGMSEADGAGPEYIWPQHGRLSDYGNILFLDGTRINSFSVSTELSSDQGKNPRLSGIGVMCHEIGHAFDLYDLYDTDFEGSGGVSKGIWGTGLMDKGSSGHLGSTPPNFSALDMEILGIGDCDTLKSGSYTLNPINKDRQYLKLLTDTEGEYFLLECREAKGWDANIGGSGLLIYHIDRSGNDAGYSDLLGKNLSAAQRWEKSQINCRPDRQCAYIVPANPDAEEASEIFFPQPGHNSFGADTSPALRYWNGNSSELALINIEANPDGSVSFDAIKAIELTEIGIFQDAAILQWEVSPSFKAIEGFTVEWTDGEHLMSEQLGADARSFTIEGLLPQKAYKAKLTLISASGDKFSVTTDIITKFYRKGTLPYIYLSGSQRNADGSFVSGAKIPLRVFNAPGLAEVQWFFNGRAIKAGEDGYYTVLNSGTLKARLLYRNGESEIIIKEIKI